MRHSSAYKDLDPSVLDAPVGEVGLDDFARRAIDDSMAVDLVFSPLASVDHPRGFEEAEALPVPQVRLEGPSEDVARGVDQGALAVLKPL